MATTTTSELLTVDGLPLNSFAYNISTGTGREGVAPIRGTNTQVLGRTGELYTPMKAIDVGTLTITMWISGCNTDGSIPTGNTAQRTQFVTNRELLLTLFSKRHAPINLVQTMPDGTTRLARGDVLEAIDFTTMAGRTRAEFAVTMRLVDTYWTSSSTATFSITNPTMGAVQTLTQFDPSTGYIQDATITVTGPITNPIITDIPSSVSIKYTGSVPSGQTWVINCNAFTSTVNGVSVMGNTTRLGTPFMFEISPLTTSAPQISLGGTSNTSATALSVVAFNKFVTA